MKDSKLAQGKTSKKITSSILFVIVDTFICNSRVCVGFSFSEYCDIGANIDTSTHLRPLFARPPFTLLVHVHLPDQGPTFTFSYSDNLQQIEIRTTSIAKDASQFRMLLMKLWDLGSWYQRSRSVAQLSYNQASIALAFSIDNSYTTRWRATSAFWLFSY